MKTVASMTSHYFLRLGSAFAVKSQSQFNVSPVIQYGTLSIPAVDSTGRFQ